MSRKIVAIVGSYRRQGTIDRLVDEILASAAENGASVNKIFLLDRTIEFCTNCRSCAQSAGPSRGTCQIDDDMQAILEEIQQADALVLGSPVNFGTVTAVMKRFIERTICLAYWPWGNVAPKLREKHSKQAVVVTSSAAPGFLTRIMTGSIPLMKKAASVMGAKTIGTLAVGLAATGAQKELPRGAVRKARRLGKKLAAI